MKVILILLLISTCYILFQHIKIFKLLKKQYKKTPGNKGIELPVSIIICARNEEINISNYLEAILNQDYNAFEVIVVDDCSTDSTSAIVQNYQKKYSHLKLIQLNSKSSDSKRNALKTGILASKYEVILLTDADCKPVSNEWIASMIAQYNPSTTCVLGYSPYEKHPTFLNAIIQFETLQTASLYFSRALEHKAYMSVGRNVMYSKALFLNSENFENEIHLTSGDDDLLVQNIEDTSQIGVCMNPKSFVLSQPKIHFSSWWKQKLRHYSTAPHYKTSSQVFLGLYHAFHALFWLSFLVLIFGENRNLAIVIVLVYLFIKSICILNVARVFHISKQIIMVWPILEASLLLLQLGLGINGSLKKHKSWQ